MSYGFQVVGTYGTTQIDETYQNFLLYQSGQVAYNNLASLPSGLIFLRIPYGTSIGQSSNTNVCDYRVYRQASQMGAGDPYGLKVYDGAGNMTFDSSFVPLRVLQIINALAYNGATSTAFSSRPWVSIHVFGVQGFAQTGNPNVGISFGQVATQNANNSVTFVQGVIGSGPPVSVMYDGYMTYLFAT